MATVHLQLLSKEQLDERLNLVETKCAKIKDRIPQLLQTKEHRQKLLHEKEKNIVEEETTCKNYEDTITTYEKEIEQLWKEVKVREDLIKQQRNEWMGKKQKITTAQTELETVRNTIKAIDKDVTGVQSIVNVLVTEVSALKEELDHRNQPPVRVDIDLTILSDGLRAQITEDIGDLYKIHSLSEDDDQRDVITETSTTHRPVEQEKRLTVTVDNKADASSSDKNDSISKPIATIQPPQGFEFEECPTELPRISQVLSRLVYWRVADRWIVTEIRGGPRDPQAALAGVTFRLLCSKRLDPSTPHCFLQKDANQVDLCLTVENYAHQWYLLRTKTVQ